jgi:hypothetical protein
MAQDAFGGTPTWTAIHNSTTTTEIRFSESTNGTLRLTDWTVDGTVITAITNGTATAAKDRTQSGGAGTFGFMNETTKIMLTHAALTHTGTTAYVNYTYTTGGVEIGNFHEARGVAAGAVKVAYGTQGSDGTLAVDGVPPTALEAWTTGPKTIVVKMSEGVANINATGNDFDIVGSDEVIGKVQATNGTNLITLTTQNPIDFRSTFTLSYTTVEGWPHPGVYSTGSNWITDAVNSPQNYVMVNHLSYDRWGQNATLGQGVGNQLLSFSSMTITNNVMPEVDDCYDCSAPEITNIEVDLSSEGSVIPVNNDNPLHIDAEVGETISFMVTLDDNRGAASIPFAGMYTNFDADASFDNHYYKNNFDAFSTMSTSYYEWNPRTDDIAYDLSDVISWSEVRTSVDPITNQMTAIFTMTIEDSMESSQIWINVADFSGNYLKQALPVTLEVSGDPSLTFASGENQKVISFFNEAVLLAIVSQWTDSDVNSNVSELSSALGIQDTVLPLWTTQLATLVSAEEIEVAEMIVAVEYIISQ